MNRKICALFLSTAIALSMTTACGNSSSSETEEEQEASDNSTADTIQNSLSEENDISDNESSETETADYSEQIQEYNEYAKRLCTVGYINSDGEYIRFTNRLSGYDDLLYFSGEICDENIISIASNGSINAFGITESGRLVTHKIMSLTDSLLELSELEMAYFKGSGSIYTGVTTDGEVIAYGTSYDEEVSSWEDIVQVAFKSRDTSGGKYPSAGVIGIKSDGTLVAAGDSAQQALEEEDLSNAMQIIGSGLGFAFLLSDGTVRKFNHIGSNTNEYASWTDIVHIFGTSDYLVGIKSDGSVVCENENIDDAISSWDNVIAVIIDDDGIIALTADDTILTYGIDIDELFAE